MQPVLIASIYATLDERALLFLRFVWILRARWQHLRLKLVTALCAHVPFKLQRFRATETG